MPKPTPTKGRGKAGVKKEASSALPPKPTLEDALGLLHKADRTPPAPPRDLKVALVTPAAIALLQSVDALVHELAAAKTRDQIQSSILNPSQEKSPDYQGYVVCMKDGRIYRGTQFHFRGESAELLVESGQQVRFALRDTDEYRVLDESLMPERLEEAMSVSELRDLLDYLSTLRPPSATR